MIIVFPCRDALNNRSHYRWLWAKQEGNCFYCKLPMMDRNAVDTHGMSATKDHYIPRFILTDEVTSWFVSTGCIYNPNIVLACWKCNIRKGGKIPPEWNHRYGPYKHIPDGRIYHNIEYKHLWVWVGTDNYMCYDCEPPNQPHLYSDNQYWIGKCSDCGIEGGL